jgi:hypothetical protein
MTPRSWAGAQRALCLRPPAQFGASSGGRTGPSAGLARPVMQMPWPHRLGTTRSSERRQPSMLPCGKECPPRPPGLDWPRWVVSVRAVCELHGADVLRGSPPR